MLTDEYRDVRLDIAELHRFPLTRVEAIVVAGTEDRWVSVFSATAARTEDRALAIVTRLGIPSTDLVCVRSATGRPEFRRRGDLRPPGPGWNASHSGPLLAVAVSVHRGIGLDVQRKETARWERVARRWFHPEENAWLASLPEEEREDGFVRLWTTREACVKSTGEGLRGFGTPQPVAPGTTGVWRGTAWRSFTLPDGCAAAAAVAPATAVAHSRFELAVCWL